MKPKGFSEQQVKKERPNCENLSVFPATMNLLLACILRHFELGGCCDV